MKIGFMGTGAIAAAMVRGISGQGHEIWVSERNAALSMALAAECGDVTRHSNEDIAANSDVVFLCLMAPVAREVLPNLAFRPGQNLISVMVDVDLESLQSYAPAAASIDITIPLPQIASGGCPLPCYPSNATVDRVFGSANPSFVVKDMRALNAHFAASALMSTTLDQIATGAAWLSAYTDDEPAAQFYLSHMLASALATVGQGEKQKQGQEQAQGATVPQMLAELSTEGGLNATLKAHLRKAKVPETLAEGLNGFQERLGL